MRFVLDASMALTWSFRDEIDPPAEALFARLAEAELVVPAHWFAEVANGRLVGERRGRATFSETDRFLSWIVKQSLLVEDVGGPAQFQTVLPFARRHELTVYDAAYLEIAKRLELPLASRDGRLNAAAASVGLELLVSAE